MSKSNAEKRAETDAQNEKVIIKTLMARPEGRRWLWLRLEESRVFASTFSDNAMQMSFAEGERNFGLRLLSQINRHAPDMYATMALEANAKTPKADDRSTPEEDTEDNG